MAQDNTSSPFGILCQPATDYSSCSTLSTPAIEVNKHIVVD
ncbi:MAG: hypothetical protein WCO98_11205 [bacterium]